MNGIMNKKIEPNEQQKKRIPGFTEGRKNQVTAGIEPKEIQYGSNNIWVKSCQTGFKSRAIQSNLLKCNKIPEN